MIPRIRDNLFPSSDGEVIIIFFTDLLNIINYIIFIFLLLFIYVLMYVFFFDVAVLLLHFAVFLFLSLILPCTCWCSLPLQRRFHYYLYISCWSNVVLLILNNYEMVTRKLWNNRGIMERDLPSLPSNLTKIYETKPSSRIVRMQAPNNINNNNDDDLILVPFPYEISEWTDGGIQFYHTYQCFWTGITEAQVDPIDAALHPEKYAFVSKTQHLSIRSSKSGKAISEKIWDIFFPDKYVGLEPPLLIKNMEQLFWNISSDVYYTDLVLPLCMDTNDDGQACRKEQDDPATATTAITRRTGTKTKELRTRTRTETTAIGTTNTYTNTIKPDELFSSKFIDNSYSITQSCRAYDIEFVLNWVDQFLAARAGYVTTSTSNLQNRNHHPFRTPCQSILSPATTTTTSSSTGNDSTSASETNTIRALLVNRKDTRRIPDSVVQQIQKIATTTTTSQLSQFSLKWTYIEELAELSLEEQLIAFATHNIIVLTHGSAETNLMAAQGWIYNNKSSSITTDTNNYHSKNYDTTNNITNDILLLQQQQQRQERHHQQHPYVPTTVIEICPPYTHCDCMNVRNGGICPNFYKARMPSLSFYGIAYENTYMNCEQYCNHDYIKKYIKLANIPQVPSNSTQQPAQQPALRRPSAPTPIAPPSYDHQQTHDNDVTIHNDYTDTLYHVLDQQLNTKIVPQLIQYCSGSHTDDNRQQQPHQKQHPHQEQQPRFYHRVLNFFKPERTVVLKTVGTTTIIVADVVPIQWYYMIHKRYTSKWTKLIIIATFVVYCGKNHMRRRKRF